MVEVAKQVEAVLTLSRDQRNGSRADAARTYRLAMSDIQQQLGNLIHKGFVTGETGWQRLPDFAALPAGRRAAARSSPSIPTGIGSTCSKVHSVESEYKALLADPQIPADPGRGG